MRKTIFALVAALYLLATFAIGASAHSTQTLHASQNTSVPRPFINTTPCNNPQFLEINTGPGGNGPTCFANNGYIGFRIDNATTLHAGNNNGWVRCYGGACGSAKTYYFSAYYTYNLGGALITQVDITGQG